MCPIFEAQFNSFVCTQNHAPNCMRLEFGLVETGCNPHLSLLADIWLYLDFKQQARCNLESTSSVRNQVALHAQTSAQTKSWTSRVFMSWPIRKSPLFILFNSSQSGIFAFQVAFSLFSTINQSACSTLDWEMISQ